MSIDHKKKTDTDMNQTLLTKAKDTTSMANKVPDPQNKKQEFTLGKTPQQGSI